MLDRPPIGVIEGFYGRPWSWDERRELAQRLGPRGLTHYVWAPKDDPKHRVAWREPFERDELDAFGGFARDSGMALGIGISPGLSMDYESTADRDALVAKVGPVVDRGASWVVLALDDLPAARLGDAARLGAAHGRLASWLAERLGVDVAVIPTDYTSTTPTPYLDALVETTPPELLIGWTGVAVVNDTITADQCRARSRATGGRRPLLWDNYPVNDGLMTDVLFMGPGRGRDTALVELTAGVLANPMVQPRASELPLASLAHWWHGRDVDACWAEDADALGWRVFAEACDGACPRMMVQDLADECFGMGWPDALGRLRDWMQRAVEVAAPGLEAEAGPWIEQVRTEARVALDALRLYERSRPRVHLDHGRGRARPPDLASIGPLAAGLALRWPPIRRSAASVMGARLSIRPVFLVDRSGHFLPRRGTVTEDANAVDALCRFAFDAAAQLTELDGTETLRVFVDGRPVDVDEAGGFDASGAEVIMARFGPLVTRRYAS